MKADEMDWACGTQREKRSTCRILVEKAEGKRPLRRSRVIVEDNTKM